MKRLHPPVTWADADPILPGRPDWHAAAACRGTGPEQWFPVRGDGTSSYPPETRAMCAACPVRGDCLDAGMTEAYGMWGGLTPQGRDALRRDALRRGAPIRARRMPVVRGVEHGTHNGYAAHRRAGTPACVACREAHAAYMASTRPSRSARGR